MTTETSDQRATPRTGLEASQDGYDAHPRKEACPFEVADALYLAWWDGFTDAANGRPRPGSTSA